MGSAVQCLPRPAAGAVAAVKLTCHLLLLKLKRAEQVIEILVDAYWSNKRSEAALKECQAEVKFLPPVLPLVMDSPPNTTMEESSDSDSDDSFNSSTDYELDFDSYFNSYASSSADSCN